MRYSYYSFSLMFHGYLFAIFFATTGLRLFSKFLDINDCFMLSDLSSSIAMMANIKKFTYFFILILLIIKAAKIQIYIYSSAMREL